MTTFHHMAVNTTTIETIQKGSIHNIALRGKASATSSTDSAESNVLCEVQRGQSHSYIVLQTLPEDNPWDMGTRRNVEDIMGQSILEWLVPWKMSPCTVRKDHTGEYGWGPVVKSMMEEYGVGSAYGRRSSRARRRRGSTAKGSQA